MSDLADRKKKEIDESVKTYKDKIAWTGLENDIPGMFGSFVCKPRQKLIMNPDDKEIFDRESLKTLVVNPFYDGQPSVPIQTSGLVPVGTVLKINDSNVCDFMMPSAFDLKPYDAPYQAPMLMDFAPMFIYQPKPVTMMSVPTKADLESEAKAEINRILRQNIKSAKKIVYWLRTAKERGFMFVRVQKRIKKILASIGLKFKPKRRRKKHG